MKKMLCSILLTTVFAVPIAGEKDMQPMEEPVPVGFVDIERYVGSWHEIAKIPNRFQQDCVRNTSATYTLREDGRLDVVNRCEEKGGTVKEARGVARIIDRASNSKLKVSFVRIFGFSIFWGDYWIIGLDDAYRYAIVGTPTRKYGWILSRTPRISKDLQEEIYAILRLQGYDPTDFEMTPGEE